MSAEVALVGTEGSVHWRHSEMEYRQGRLDHFRGQMDTGLPSNRNPALHSLDIFPSFYDDPMEMVFLSSAYLNRSTSQEFLISVEAFDEDFWT